eukprot:TRINITY_DN439_c0_g1_i1.p1 TRINITY_DN439_c0_g1~~TRINITY_DN439_c0_g1_i1.p1  ORF type:complete len:401 (-),score=84.24 TRINITY_DN439_c0_g1_i1:54-1127(-)
MKNERASLIAQYNSAVNDWNNEYAGEFKNASGFPFSFQTYSNSATYYTRTSGYLFLSSSADPLNDYAHSGEVFLSYTPYKFATASTQSMIPSVVLNLTYTLTFYYGTNHLVFQDNFWMPNKDLVDGISCTSSEISKYGSRYSCMQAKCSQLGGNHVFNGKDYTCHYSSYAQSTCIKVSNNLLTGWTLHSGSWSGDIGGCFKGTPGYTAMLTTTPTTGVVSAEIRHERDPLVVAAQLTNGSLNFGLTAGQNARLGLILLIVGGVITAIVVLCIVGTLRCVRDWMENRRGYKPVGVYEGNNSYVVVQQQQNIPPPGSYNPNPPQAYGYAPSAPPAPGYYNPQPPQGYAYAPSAPPAPYR